MSIEYAVYTVLFLSCLAFLEHSPSSSQLLERDRYEAQRFANILFHRHEQRKAISCMVAAVGGSCRSLEASQNAAVLETRLNY